MSTPERPDENPMNEVPSPPAVLESAGLGNAVTRRTWALVLAGAVVAGLASWLVGEGLLQRYKPSFEPITRPHPSAADILRITQNRIEYAALAFGATGGLLGLWLGVAGGVARRSIKEVALAGGLGLLLGGLGAGGAARLSLWVIYTKIDVQAEDLLQTLLSHEALWTPIGIAAGLALGIGLGGGRWWRTMIGGLIGASFATVVYEFIGALVLSTHGTHQPLADSMGARALAQILIPIGTAIGSILVAQSSTRKPK